MTMKNKDRSKTGLAVALVVSVSLNLALVLTRLAPAKVPERGEAPAPSSGQAAVPPALEPYAAMGSYMAENNRIADLGWTRPQFDAFMQGMRASYEKRPFAFDERARELRDRMSAKVQAMIDAETPDPVEAYFQTLRETEGVKPTPSGLHYRITLEGDRETPGPEDTVVISYTARLPDGTSLASLSRPRVRVRVADLLPGLAEGVQLLRGGGKALVYVPPALSYGDGTWPEEVPRGAPIVFFLELHEVVRPQ
ncbi:MAG: hypothetical protein D6781_03000 [Verrucomicrobia bacterium]|nr:MAG: hypothetical protein D6781_03000 [Verrucomicrobiota bacterium]